MKRFEVGARVVEPTYGLGSVVAVEDAYTRVQFDEHGIRSFSPACRISSRATSPCRQASAAPSRARNEHPRKPRNS